MNHFVEIFTRKVRQGKEPSLRVSFHVIEMCPLSAVEKKLTDHEGDDNLTPSTIFRVNHKLIVFYHQRHLVDLKTDPQKRSRAGPPRLPEQWPYERT